MSSLWETYQVAHHVDGMSTLISCATEENSHGNITVQASHQSTASCHGWQHWQCGRVQLDRYNYDAVRLCSEIYVLASSCKATAESRVQEQPADQPVPTCTKPAWTDIRMHCRLLLSPASNGISSTAAKKCLYCPTLCHRSVSTHTVWHCRIRPLCTGVHVPLH